MNAKTKKRDIMNSINLDLKKDEIYKINDLIEEIILKKDLKIELIVEEVFVNILNYSRCSYIKVNVSFEEGKLRIEFIDNGKKFNCLLIDNPKFPNSIKDAKIGGLGIYLTKKLADDLSYKYEGGENHLTIIKRIVNKHPEI